MKAKITVLLGFLFAASASAEFRTWSRSDGKTAQLELLSVTGNDGEKVGKFKMRNGRSVELKISVFSEADAKLLEDWKPEPPATPEAASVFDDMLDGNLVKLSGKSLESFEDLKKPAKYYVFFHTASWCPSCQQFVPSLVEFYRKNKTDDFEIILISADRDESAMEKFASSHEMPWPQVKFSKITAFTKKFPHGVKSYPTVIVCDLEGKIVSADGTNLNALGELLK